jgi:hypothetical protein
MTVHPYEYKLLVEYLNPEETGRYPHFSRIEDQQGFTSTLNEIFENLPKSVHEGWEVVSHDIMPSRNTAIITVLLRRPVKK